jgi:hypothetical protein
MDAPGGPADLSEREAGSLVAAHRSVISARWRMAVRVVIEQEHRL